MPSRAARFSTRIRSATASAAASGDAAFSISATSADPTTAASAIPPSTVTCVGSEIPKPTAIGSVVNFRILRAKPGSSARKRFSRPGNARARNQIKKSARRAAQSSRFAHWSTWEPPGKLYRDHCACIAARYSSASSSVKSVARTPSAPACCTRYRKFLKPHLQNRIEITEKHERHFRSQTNPPDEINNACQS